MYVIGLSAFEFVRVESNHVTTLNERGNIDSKIFYTKIVSGVPNNTATFFNNLSEAKDVLTKLLKSDIKVESFLPDDDEISVEQLKIFSLEPHIVYPTIFTTEE